MEEKLMMRRLLEERLLEEKKKRQWPKKNPCPETADGAGH